jgi:SAM-dependent methyltransferase
MSEAEEKNYLSIVSRYESCLEQYGDTHLGVAWPRKEDADTRYKVMLEVIRREDEGRAVRLLDFGCGASHLYEYILARGVQNVAYSGLDLSEKFVRLSRSKFPANEYYCVDLLEDGANVPSFEYVVMNGVFTERNVLTFDEMFAYFRRIIKKVFEKAEVGIAFNVMSKHVDWELDRLFHLPFDALAAFLTKELTRNFVFRNDYKLYEYTAYVYR